MGERVERVAILGLGLMGASLGMALRAGDIARAVAGYDAAAGVAEQAHACGAVDEACKSIAEVVEGAKLVVLAAPPLALRGLLQELGPQLAEHAVVTDVASTKAAVTAWAEELLPHPERFVGGHPMAGKEQSGVAAAEATLYQGCVWCLTPSARTAPETLARVELLVRALGARPVVLTAERHDAAVAAISHLPRVAAAALTLTAAGDLSWPEAQTLAAGGFRDTTRIAAGDARMARDICLTNAGPLVACLDAYIARLRTLRDQIATGDAAIATTFAAARARREGWQEARDAAMSFNS
jgi:prephenate dehydrogenase